MEILIFVAAGESLKTVFMMIAFGSTLFFALRLAMMLIGLGDHDVVDVHGDVDFAGDADIDATDAHLDGDAHVDTEASFTVLSLQSILAFLMGLGWCGWMAVEWPVVGPFLAVPVGVVGGFILMVFTAWLMYQMRKLGKEVRFDIYQAIGRRGKVYLTIPEKGKGSGQVEINIAGKKMILSAVSAGSKIESFKDVMVISVEDGNTLMVEPAETEEDSA